MLRQQRTHLARYEADEDLYMCHSDALAAGRELEARKKALGDALATLGKLVSKGN